MAKLDLNLVKGAPLGFADEDAVLEFIEANEICTIEIDTLETLENGNVHVELSPFHEEDQAIFGEFVASFMQWLYS